MYKTSPEGFKIFIFLNYDIAIRKFHFIYLKPDALFLLVMFLAANLFYLIHSLYSKFNVI